MIESSDLEELRYTAQRACLSSGTVEIDGPTLLNALEFVDESLKELDAWNNLGRIERIEERLDALNKLEDEFTDRGDVDDLRTNLKRLQEIDKAVDAFPMLNPTPHLDGVEASALRDTLKAAFAEVERLEAEVAKLKESKSKPAPKKRAAPKRAKRC